VITAIAKYLSHFGAVQMRKTTSIKSQAAISRLASSIFSDSQRGAGFAILHNTEGCRDEHADKLSLIRFNEHFVKLIDFEGSEGE